MKAKTALIIGAGPAGLTAAFELATRSEIQPLVLEKSECMGGISRTIVYKGNRIDLGGHRFFSKSDRVMKWWLRVMPLQGGAEGAQTLAYQGQTAGIAAGAGPDPQQTDRVMLLRNRKSRIYFLRQFFEYPIQLSPDTLGKLGLARTVRIAFSYARTLLGGKKPETTLEQFFMNRFGRELYLTFFKSYTEKIWGVPCDQISAEWGAQRIKDLSITRAVAHFLKKAFSGKSAGDLAQKQTATSLIEKFLYPKLGPGQLWDYVADDIRQAGGRVETGWVVEKLFTEGFRVTAAEVFHAETGARKTCEADYFFSTMPVKELLRCLQTDVPARVLALSDNLPYRDFITVGLLVKKLALGHELIPDNWVYIQEPDVMVGRMQIFNNWSPWMAADPDTVWLGLEYFCYETDALWQKDDVAMKELAVAELAKIGIIAPADVLDGCVIRVPKTYPAYFGEAYSRFVEIREYTDQFENLFLIGRNGMHKYNNQDHSMLTAMTAVDNILAGITDKANIWALNTEMEYHESKEK